MNAPAATISTFVSTFAAKKAEQAECTRDRMTQRTTRRATPLGLRESSSEKPLPVKVMSEFNSVSPK
jgi:hypothetical protein